MVEFATLPLKRYADFSGRSRRSEFWYWVLAVFVVQIIAAIIDQVIGIPLLALIVVLGTFIPNIAVAVRRLHDTGRSGWWYLIGLVPLVGAILLIIWFATEGDSGPNQYGPDPKGGTGGGQWGGPPAGQQWGQPADQQWGQQPAGQPAGQQWGQPTGQQWGQPAGQQPAEPQWGQPQAPQQPPGQWNQPSPGGWNTPSQ